MGVGAMRAAVVCFSGLVSFASAQCTATTKVLRSQRDINNFNCANFIGTLQVKGATVTRNFETPIPTINLDVLQTITGSLEFSDIHIKDNSLPTQPGPSDEGPPGFAQVTEQFTISAKNLATIDQSLSFSNLQNLSMPFFTNLQSVVGITFSSVRFVNETQMDAEHFSALGSLRDLTFEDTLVTAIGPLANSVEPSEGDATFVATGNSDLDSIDFAGFSSPDDDVLIDIQNNKAHPSVSFYSLVSAHIALKDVRSFSAPFLTQLGPATTDSNQSLGIISGNTLSTLQFPNLTMIRGTLEIEENQDLTSISMPKLQHANVLQIRNNPNLQNVVINPKNSANVSGTISIDSSGSVNCNSINQQLSGARVLCPASTPQSSASGSPNGDSSGGSNSSGLSTGAKAGIGVGAAIGALVIIGAAIFFCCRRRRNKSYSTREISSEPYSKSQHSYTESGEMAYSKVPFNPAGEAGGVSEPHSEEHTPTSALAHDWSPPEREVPSAEDRVELEEQQGMRHEMDARSLPDMDSDDDEEADTRSLEDIERIHRER